MLLQCNTQNAKKKQAISTRPFHLKWVFVVYFSSHKNTQNAKLIPSNSKSWGKQAGTIIVSFVKIVLNTLEGKLFYDYYHAWHAYLEVLKKVCYSSSLSQRNFTIKSIETIIPITWTIRNGITICGCWILRIMRGCTWKGCLLSLKN